MPSLQASKPDPPGFSADDALSADDSTVVMIHGMSAISACSSCGAVSDRIHSGHPRCLADLPIAGRRVVLVLQARRRRGSPSFAFGDHWDRRLGFLAAYIALILQFSAAVSRAGLIVVAPIAENLALDLRTASRKAWLAFSIRCQRSATRESLYWSPGSERAEYSIPSIRGAVYDGSCVSNGGAAGERIRFPCPCRKSDPNILMVKSAENWRRQNASDSLHASRNRRVLVQR
jgi:hypothetical protein